MPRDGSGTFTRSNGVYTGSTVWQQDAAEATPLIRATRFDTHDQDIADALTASMAKDGQTVPTANLPMGTFRHTGVGDGAALTDYLSVKQGQNSSVLYGGTSGGSANAQTLTLSPAMTAYVAGQTFRFIAGFSNTGAATLNVNGVGVKNLRRRDGTTALSANDIVSGRLYDVTYDGTNFVLRDFEFIRPLQDSAYVWGGTSGGTANAQTITLSPALPAYVAGQKFVFIAGATNTAAITLNVNGLGTKTITRRDGSTNLNANEIISGQPVLVLYDGTNFRLISNSDEWQAWTPTYSASGSMTFTSVTTDDARYQIIGKTVHFSLKATGTTGGTAGVFLRATPPVNAVGSIVFHYGALCFDAANFGGFATLTINEIGVAKYDSSNWGLGAARTIGVAGTYQIA